MVNKLVAIVVPVVLALGVPCFASPDWLTLFRGAHYSGDFTDCENGNMASYQNCHVELNFTGEDQFGALTGTLDLGLDGQTYDLRFEILPQSEEPFRLEIKNSKYIRRLKSRDAGDLLQLNPPTGDLEPTQIRFFPETTGLTFVFHQNFLMKGQTYLVQGSLKRK